MWFSPLLTVLIVLSYWKSHHYQLSNLSTEASTCHVYIVWFYVLVVTKVRSEIDKTNFKVSFIL